MTIGELKEYIFDNNKIEYVLEQLHCHNIQYHEKHNYFSACFPDGDNPQGINIKNDKYLNYRSFSRNVSYDEGKDIVDLIQYIFKKDFKESVKYLHDLFGLSYSFKKQAVVKDEKINPLEVFTKHLKANRKQRINVEDIQTLSEDILDNYIPLLHLSWVREGITERARSKFGIAYSFKRNRIMIAIRHWLTGELLGFNARTTIENFEEFGIKKYWLTPTYQKANNLYGLYENRKSIEKAGYLVIAESEKSVMKRFSLFDETVVALQGKSMSEEQRRIILGLNIREVIVALDSDVNLNEVRFLCEQFYGLRNVSYMCDKYQLLKDKQAPMDAHNKVYQFLFKNRVKYDEKEHNEYLNSLKKR